MDDSVKERLKRYLAYKKISQRKFSEMIGVTPAYISSMRVAPSPDKREEISEKFPDLNMRWLISGEGGMIIDDVPMDVKHERAIPDDLLEKHHVLIIENEKLKAQLELMRELLDSYVKK